MKTVKMIELFAGIGAAPRAAKILFKDWTWGADPVPPNVVADWGYKLQVLDAVENTNVIDLYNIIHGTNFEKQDVLTWDKDITCDWLHASTPCQAFSFAGKKLGAADKRGAPLWEATVRIIKRTKPKLITLENVKGLLSEKHKDLVDWYINQLDELGYHTEYRVINSLDCGIPQNRERVFFISVPKNIPIEWYTTNGPLKSRSWNYELILDRWTQHTWKTTTEFKETNTNYILPRSKDGEFINGSYNRVWKLKNHYVGTITKSSPPQIGHVENGVLYYRKLNALECTRLMGFWSEDYDAWKQHNISDNRILSACGNSMVVNAVEYAITPTLRNILKQIEEK